MPRVTPSYVPCHCWHHHPPLSLRHLCEWIIFFSYVLSWFIHAIESTSLVWQKEGSRALVFRQNIQQFPPFFLLFASIHYRKSQKEFKVYLREISKGFLSRSMGFIGLRFEVIFLPCPPGTVCPGILLVHARAYMGYECVVGPLGLAITFITFTVSNFQSRRCFSYLNIPLEISLQALSIWEVSNSTWYDLLYHKWLQSLYTFSIIF